MRTSIIRSIAQFIRRPSDAKIFHRGLATRSYATAAVVDPDDRLSTKRISDKQAKITTTLILEGLEASEIKTLLPLMHQHLNVGEAKRALNENLSSALETLKKLVSVSCYTSVTLEGFKDFEEKPLRPFIQQFTSVDGFEPPKDMAIVERVSDNYTKRSTKYSI